MIGGITSATSFAGTLKLKRYLVLTFLEEDPLPSPATRAENGFAESNQVIALIGKVANLLSTSKNLCASKLLSSKKFKVASLRSEFFNPCGENDQLVVC